MQKRVLKTAISAFHDGLIGFTELGIVFYMAALEYDVLDVEAFRVIGGLGKREIRRCVRRLKEAGLLEKRVVRMKDGTVRGVRYVLKTPVDTGFSPQGSAT